jgi:hypothetical protein
MRGPMKGGGGMKGLRDALVTFSEDLVIWLL